MSELIIRPAREEDSPALRGLWAEVFGDGEELIGAFFRLLWRPEDCAVAAENMMLAADSLGVGSCYIGQGWTALSDPYGQEILRQWNIRPDYYAVMQLLLGYPRPEDGHPAPKRRKEGRILRF